MLYGAMPLDLNCKLFKLMIKIIVQGKGAGAAVKYIS